MKDVSSFGILRRGATIVASVDILLSLITLALCTKLSISRVYFYDESLPWHLITFGLCFPTVVLIFGIILLLGAILERQCPTQIWYWANVSFLISVTVLIILYFMLTDDETMLVLVVTSGFFVIPTSVFRLFECWLVREWYFKLRDTYPY